MRTPMDRRIAVARSATGGGMSTIVVEDIGAVRDRGARTLRERRRGSVQRTQGLRAIACSVETLHALSEAWPVPIVVHQDEELLWSNGAFTRLIGSDAAHGNRLSDWLETPEDETDRGRTEDAAEAVFSARVRTGRGTVVPVEVRRYEILFGDRAATLRVLHDLAAKEQAARACAQHERLASLGRLAASLGHEINNPLSYVVSNLGFLRAQLADLGARVAAAGASALAQDLAAGIEEARAAAADALEGAERVAAIVRDVRVLSRIESRALTKVGIPGVVDSALRIARARLAETARVSVDVAATPSVEANDTALLQVFVNLLVNAADACAELPDQQHEVHVRCFTDDRGRAVVEIRDSGSGISDEIREHLFEPFFTTKASGSGFGLAISFAIIESLGGTLTLESDGTRGAVARVVLPPARGGSALPKARRGSSPRRARGAGRVATGATVRSRAAPARSPRG